MQLAKPISSNDLMRTQILKLAMIAAMLACAIGIAAFARGAYDYSARMPVPEASDLGPRPG